MPDRGGFDGRSEVAIANPRLQSAIRVATGAMVSGRASALSGLADADEVRDVARAIRARTLARLPDVLDEWSTNLEAAGGTVHWAADAGEAVAAVRDILQRTAARRVVKSKSMASEEIHLNGALAADGIEVVESDLGEFIIQLAGETPSHIIIPAIHKDRYDVAELFSADAGRAVPADIDVEAAYARQRLRSAFLAADVGISGVNFAVAETGSICMVTNEGNGRMVASLPRVHIAIMGMERAVSTWSELDVMLSLLARSATGQALTVYTSIITGPRQPGELDGPDELHVIVLDNGRHRVLGSEYREALACIRCGACLNACPVYRHAGGHSYGSVYSGPIGAVLTPLLHPEDAASRELAHASSLCGACVDVCPVRIPLVDMLLALRRRDVDDVGGTKRLGFAVWSRLWSTRAGFTATRTLVRAALPLGRRLRNAPGWGGAWLRTRRAPASPGPSLARRLAARARAARR